jgi:hypothetical protein
MSWLSASTSMTSFTATVVEADEVAMTRDGTPCKEMSQFVHPAPGTAAVTVAANLLDFGHPPTVVRATASESASLDEAPDSMRQGGGGRGN